MKRTMLSLIAVAVVGLVVVASGAAIGLQRSDCPGKITCPLTGDEVCQDQCPLANAEDGSTLQQRSCCLKK